MALPEPTFLSVKVPVNPDVATVTTSPATRPARVALLESSVAAAVASYGRETPAKPEIIRGAGVMAPEMDKVPVNS